MVVFTKLLSEQQYTSVFFHVCADKTEAENLFVSVGHLYFNSYELPVLSLGSSYLGPLNLNQCALAWPCAHGIAFTSLGRTFFHIQRLCPALRFMCGFILVTLGLRCTLCGPYAVCHSI